MIRARIAALAIAGLAAAAPAFAQSQAPTPTSAATPAVAVTAAPAAAPTPVASPAFTYFYTPPPQAFPTVYTGPGAPQILSVALSSKILITPGIARVYVRTNPEVVSVTARALIREIDLPKIRPGEFGGAQYVPRLPDEFLNRYYDVELTATTADGRTATVSLSVGVK